MGKCSWVWEVFRCATQWTVRHSQSQDPTASRMYSESTKPFNAAISCRRLTNLYFISVTSYSNPTVSCTSLYSSSAVLLYCSLTPALVHHHHLPPLLLFLHWPTVLFFHNKWILLSFTFSRYETLILPFIYHIHNNCQLLDSSSQILLCNLVSTGIFLQQKSHKIAMGFFLPSLSLPHPWSTENACSQPCYMFHPP